MAAQNQIFRLAPIPKIFYSEATNRKFMFCVECNKYLLSDDIMYVVEKAIRRYKRFDTEDTVFEYAMCVDCQEKIIATFSDISRERLQNYFQQHIDYDGRMHRLEQGKDVDIQDWISRCAVKNTPKESMEEYQLFALCQGESIILHASPFLFGSEAMDEIADLLSNKTIGEIDNFKRQLINGPPEFSDILDDVKLLFM